MTFLAIFVDLVVADPGVDLFQRNLAFEAGESCAQAEMRTVTKPKVSLRAPKDVEHFRRRTELPIVVVGGSDQQKH